MGVGAGLTLVRTDILHELIYQGIPDKGSLRITSFVQRLMRRLLEVMSRCHHLNGGGSVDNSHSQIMEVYGMKRYGRAFLLLIIFLGASSLTVADDFGRHNVEKDNWFIVQYEKLREKAKSNIEKSIEEIFEDNVFKYFTDSIAGAFSDKLLSGLGGLFSIGPLISLDAVFNIGGSGGSDVRQIALLVETMLKAIEEAKYEIIQSVEQQFRDETTARLNTIISELSVYNSRSESARSASYQLLNDLIGDAFYVMNRIQIKPGDSIYQDVKNYMNIAGIQILMQKEYTHWLYLREIDSEATIEEIEEETARVLSAQLWYPNNYIINSSLGSLSFWESEFRNEFHDSVASVTNPSSISEAQILSMLREGKDYLVDYSGSYSYSMGGGTVPFFLIATDEWFNGMDGAMTDTTITYDVHDANGEYLFTFQEDRRSRHTPRVGPAWANVVRGIAPGVINRHKESDNAFQRYVLSGYLPLKDMLDEWWKATDSAVRPKSEVDIFVESTFPNFSDLVVYTSIGSSDPSLDDKFLFSIRNDGGAVAEDVAFSFRSLTPFEILRTDAVFLDCSSGENSHTCSVPDISPGDRMEFSVSFYPEAGFEGPVDDIEIIVSTTSSEILIGNNHLESEFHLE